MARPTIYTEDLCNAILVRMAAGDSLRSICRDDGFPAISTVLLWVVDGRHPEFSEQYTKAREAQGYFYADAILEVAEQTIRGDVEPAAARVVIDAYKWNAERNASKAYGTKNSRVEVSGVDGAPIQHEVKLSAVDDFANLLAEYDNGAG